jgi:hypothetical protein
LQFSGYKVTEIIQKTPLQHQTFWIVTIV